MIFTIVCPINDNAILRGNIFSLLKIIPEK